MNQRQMIGQSELLEPKLYAPLHILLQLPYSMSAALMMGMVIDMHAVTAPF
ncbi:hypothetical protein D3C73_1658640 [compost metagenome]